MGEVRFRFSYSRQWLDENETPNSMEMKENDLVEVHREVHPSV